MLFWNGILSSARSNVQTKLQKMFISVKNAASVDLCLNMPVVYVCVHTGAVILMTLILSRFYSLLVGHASVSFHFEFFNSKASVLFFPP